MTADVWLQTLVGDELLLRNWCERDRNTTGELIARVLSEYGLVWEPNGADADVLRVEQEYFGAGGEFFVLEHKPTAQIVGSVGWYPLPPETNAPLRAELRKMYLERSFRGRGLGRLLLAFAEARIRQTSCAPWQVILESASVLERACALYRRSGYTDLAAATNQTKRCDVVLTKWIAPLAPLCGEPASHSHAPRHEADNQNCLACGEHVDTWTHSCSAVHFAIASCATATFGSIVAWLPLSLRAPVPTLWRVTLWLVQKQNADVSSAQYMWMRASNSASSRASPNLSWHFVYCTPWYTMMDGNGAHGACACDWACACCACGGRCCSPLPPSLRCGANPQLAFRQVLVPGPASAQVLLLPGPQHQSLVADLCLLRLRDVKQQRFSGDEAMAAAEYLWCRWDELAQRIAECDPPMRAFLQQVWRILDTVRCSFEPVR
jgi:putative acetyltransferase